MAITLIVEDGTGLPNANAFLSLQEFKDYWLNKGVTFTDTDETLKAWIIDATIVASTSYQWRGRPATDTQALAFPRTNCYDDYGKNYSNSMPQIIKNGTAELANHRKDISTTSKTESVSKNITSKTMGPVSVTYGSSTSNSSLIGSSISIPTARWFSPILSGSGLRADRGF